MDSCRIEGCNKSVRVQSRQLCSMHYDRWRKTGDPEGILPGRWVGYEKPRCKADDCAKTAWSLGYCRTHHLRFKKYGNPHAGIWHKRKKGEGKKWHESKNGYILRIDHNSPHSGSNGHVYQHRQVMAEMLGRPLRKGENVHHRNGNRKDNRPENLELWVSGQPAGQRVQDVARWAIELLSSGKLKSALKLEPEMWYELSKLEQAIKDLKNGSV